MHTPRGNPEGKDEVDRTHSLLSGFEKGFAAIAVVCAELGSVEVEPENAAFRLLEGSVFVVGLF